MVTIRVKATRQQVRDAIRLAAGVASGRRSAQGVEASRQMMVRLGLEALTFIRQAFVAKAHGGIDEAGETWEPLQRTTIAYGRRHPGVPFPGRKRAPYSPSWMLTAKQRKRWWEIYSAMVRGVPTKRTGDAKEGSRIGSRYHARSYARDGYAAAMAWRIIKVELGAKTLLETYGDTKVDILRDTGLLLNSLSPGTTPDSTDPNKQPDQVFNVARGSVVVGTNRKWAAVHHYGSRNGRIPQRRLWPEPSKWPKAWWGRLMFQAKIGLVDIVTQILKGRAA